MYIQLLTLIPALAFIVWAVVDKFKAHHIFEAVSLIIAGIAVIMNGFVVNLIMWFGHEPWWLRLAQQMFSSAIVPLAYMYFSRQMGRQWNNVTAVICWSLIAIVLLPNITIILGSQPVDAALIKPFTINLILNGRLAFSCHTADFVILAQALMTVFRMIPAGIMMHKYGLKLSTKMTGFYIWWGLAVVFIVFTSSVTLKDLMIPAVGWSYYIFYSFLICSIYCLIGLRFDLYPVVTEDEGEAVQIDAFVAASHEMAERLRSLIAKEEIYLQSGYSSEDAAHALATNRTYFSRMMQNEFGMKFSDLMNQYRVEKAKELLRTTDMSIADIALNSGFSDSSYMNKKFHLIVGVSPTVYRDSLTK